MFEQMGIPTFVIEALTFFVLLFVFAIGLVVLGTIILYVIDRTQTKHAVRRNFPVIGRGRYWMEHIGVFFRQYFFAMDREEMPFNREQRSYVYRAAKRDDTTLAFGSTRNLHTTGTIMFANCAFPTMRKDAVKTREVEVGPYCTTPYKTASLFNVSGMSYGALSKVAVEALSKGSAKAGAWMNTGEGGLSSYHLSGGGDIVFQIGTAKYGVRDENGNLSDDKLEALAAKENIRMFELKLAQGAKPGKGGILPGEKVSEEIAEIRGIKVGEDSISPNRHPEINDIESLLDSINHIRDVTGKPVGIKTVMGSFDWLDEMLQLIHKRGVESAPDFITIDSGDGGTGAAPMSLMDYMGLPIWESLPMVADRLNGFNLKDRIKIIASGKLITPADVAWALCMGADFVVSARGFMFSLGCIQALQCNKNTCPTGITTHDPKLQRGLVAADKAERVANYIEHVMYEVGVIAHSCGVKEPRELNRSHAIMVQDNGRPLPMSNIFPNQKEGSLM
ncbi:FMN-binding glutamate synthase family protein [Kordiimonas sp. SCSIO 12610]|uniref:FMN-binding glutamate synthase family protein n=1 Tax=Kordiimonas sp. SCSIO 12610 TaxID=2829597 RepID=UPI00210DCB7F|nr:FMN-binding glutamate synthase family protein [Kordiimonas sp. SCSIO 12610]UTW56639.1 FMN-binding glutamate synthase family protein [Kordiimonas sp. SCSIO 12610]